MNEVVGALAYYKAQRGLVVTNHELTRNTLILADSNDVLVWQRERLIEELTGTSNELSQLNPHNNAVDSLDFEIDLT